MLHRALVAALVFAFTAPLAGCTGEPDTNREKEPWDTAGRFKHERMRSPEQAQQLEHRLVYNQSDR